MKIDKEINPRWLFVIGTILIASIFTYFNIFEERTMGFIVLGMGLGMMIEVFCKEVEDGNNK
ncbi:hypothetical protein LCGC14_0439080 [marine sediment metagenome]|uniref:Uncharacterized protein n=1 Tax=marine sediment metagenome TaxID=412755 RepID=A0A0F9SKV4_9ZZZZ